MYWMCYCYVGKEEEVLEIFNIGFLCVFIKLYIFFWKGLLEGWIRCLIFYSLVDYYCKYDCKLCFFFVEDWDVFMDVIFLYNFYFEDMVSLIDQLFKVIWEVFWFYVVDGYIYVEIGDCLGISVGILKWYLFNVC